MEKKQYQIPVINVVLLNANESLLTSSTSITGTSGSPGEDLYYGGYDDDGEGD